MFNKKRIFVFAVFVLFMFLFITFAGGTPQNQAVATRLVTFIDGYDNSKISQQKVIVGEDAEVPEAPSHDAMLFTGWYLEEDRNIEVTDFTNILEDLTVVAGYGSDINRNGVLDEDDEYFDVTFRDTFDNSVLKTQNVLVGMDAVAPQPPKHDGLTFVGWSRGFTNITANITVDTVYLNNVNVDVTTYSVTFIDGDTEEVISVVEVGEGLSATPPVAPKHEKRVFDYWKGNYTEVRQNEIVRAIYADDLNENNKPDYTEHKFAVIYDKGLNSAKGTPPVDENRYLEGLTYEVLDRNSLTVEKATFIGWSKVNPNKVIESLGDDEALVLVSPKAILTMGNSNVEYYAIWAVDRNENNIPDYREKLYNIKFTTDSEYANLLDGTLTFEILTGLKFYDEVVLPTIIDDNTDNVAFDKWEPVLPDSDSIVTADMTFKAVFAEDKNNNDIPDYRDTYHTVKFVAGENGALSGTLEFKVLTGLTFSEVKVPTPQAKEGYAFDKWNPSIPTADTKVESDLTYTAVFAEDKNNNNIPDYRDTYHTVKFVAGENGALLGTLEFEVLTGLTFSEVKVPTPQAKEGYAFDKWNPSIPTADTKVESDLTYTAVFAEDKNNNDIPDYRDTYHTVKFVAGENGALLGTLEFKVLTGLTFSEVKVPTPQAKEGYAFDKWNPSIPTANTKVESDLTYTAVFAEDKNNNNIPDYRDTYHTVKFVAGENGTLSGTLEFEVLTGLTFSEVKVPTPQAKEGYAFDKWNPSIPTANTKVERDLTYTAVFAEDKNDNEVPDYREEKYTITYNKGLATSGTVPTDENEYLDNTKITVLGNSGNLSLENAVFIGWSTVPQTKIVSEEPKTIIVEGNEITVNKANVTLYAVFAEDKNNNNIPDYADKYYSIIFQNFDRTILSTQNVLEGTSATAPSNPTRTNTQEYSYVFVGWDKEFNNVQFDLVITAQYNQIKNKYTVTFVDYNGAVLGSSTVEYGTAAEAPQNPTRQNYTFTGWDKEFNNVTTNITVKAQYSANIVSIRAEEKPNAQLQFQVGSTDNIKNHINVYKIYADGREELANSNEYTTDFSTAQVVNNKTLTVRLNGLTDNTLKYDITERPAYPTKFEVIYQPDKSYRKTSSSYCIFNCDSNSKTERVNTNYTLLEIIEHYDENIKVNKVNANYTNGTSMALYVSNRVRWSFVSQGSYYDPVYIASRGNSYNQVDVMNSELIISTLEITYSRAGYGNFTIVFEYNAVTNEFKAISETKH